MSLFAPSIVFVVGIVVSSIQLRQLLRATASNRWPQAPGKITAAAPTAIAIPSGVRHGSPSATPVAGIEYAYSVDNRHLKGNRVSFAGAPPERWGNPSTYTATLLQRYGVGAQVSVRYNPQNPAESVLEPGANRSNYWALLPGLGIMAVGLLWIAA